MHFIPERPILRPDTALRSFGIAILPRYCVAADFAAATLVALEYDTPRAGSFTPLRLVPRNKSIILGLISSKTAELEDEHITTSRKINTFVSFLSRWFQQFNPNYGSAPD